MAQNQQIAPDTLPANFGQWDSSPDTLPANFSGFDADKSAPETKSSALMRFLKGGASSYFNATLNAGPTSAAAPVADQPYNPPKTNTEALKRMWSTITGGVKAIPDIDPVEGVKDLASQFNPIDVQKFQSGDTAGGMGSSLMNLLLLRKAFKGGAPEYGRPAQGAEVVSPLTGGTPARSPLALPAAPIELGPSSITPQTQEGVLPAARKVYDSGKVQYLTRPLRPGESPDVAKNTNTLSQSYLIDKLREQMNAQTETETPVQTIERRMRESAATPYDRATAPKATASGPVESPAEQGGHAGNGVSSAEELSRPGTNYVVSKSGQLTYHGKAYAPESTPNGASHVTALPDGTLRVNAGPKLNSAQEMALRQALPKPVYTTPGVPMSDAELMDRLVQSLPKSFKAKTKTAGQ